MAPNLLQLFALLLACSSSALALTCYKCDSSQNKFCAYGITSIIYDSMDCNEGGNLISNLFPKECVKLVAQDRDGNEYIGRGCMPATGGACGAVAKTLSFFGSLDGNIRDLQCYSCDSDKCNSADRIGVYTFLGVALAAVVFLI